MSVKRTILLLAFMLLAGYLANIQSDKIIEILTAVGSPLAAYVAVKGSGIQNNSL